MSDDLTRHPAVIEARETMIRRFRSIMSDAYWIVPENTYPEIDRIIAAAVAKVLADAASQSAIELCKTIVNFEQFGDIPTVARLVDAYADTKVRAALSKPTR